MLSAPLWLTLIAAPILESAIPPFFAPDENRHFAWAFDPLKFSKTDDSSQPACESARRFVATVDYEAYFIKRSERFRGWESLKEDPQNPTWINNCRSVESAKGYVGAYSYPQSRIAHVIASAFKPSAELSSWISTYRIARLLAFLGFWMLGALALWRYLKSKQAIDFFAYLLFFAILSIRSVLQQSLSVSSDVIVFLSCFSMAFLLIDIYRQGQRRILALESGLHYVIILLACLTKPNLLGLLLATAFLIYLKNRRLDRQLLTLLSITTITILKGFIFVSNTVSSGYPAWANPSLQKQFILEHPLQTFWILFKSTSSKAFEINAGALSWLSFRMPHAAKLASDFALWVTLISTAAFAYIYRPLFRWNARRAYYALIILSTLLISNLLVGLALYLGYTSVGAADVRGLQVRYFVPVWIFVFYLSIIPFRRLSESNTPTESNKSPTESKWRSVNSWGPILCTLVGVALFAEMMILRSEILTVFWEQP